MSPAYLKLQQELHARPNGYGGKGHKWLATVCALIDELQASSVLDYGCGEGTLAKRLRQARPAGLRIDEYDPAITSKSGTPSFADLVVTTDVLEHVEPDRLEAVLAHVHMLARKAVFFVVALDPANKILADGRNAHLILQPPEWWAATITRAGFRYLPLLPQLPMPPKYNQNPEAARKRWIAVATPC